MSKVIMWALNTATTVVWTAVCLTLPGAQPQITGAEAVQKLPACKQAVKEPPDAREENVRNATQEHEEILKLLRQASLRRAKKDLEDSKKYRDSTLLHIASLQKEIAEKQEKLKSCDPTKARELTEEINKIKTGMEILQKWLPELEKKINRLEIFFKLKKPPERGKNLCRL